MYFAVRAARWEHAIMPKANKPKQKIEGIKIFAVERVKQAMEYCRRWSPNSDKWPVSIVLRNYSR